MGKRIPRTTPNILQWKGIRIDGASWGQDQTTSPKVPDLRRRLRRSREKIPCPFFFAFVHQSSDNRRRFQVHCHLWYLASKSGFLVTRDMIPSFLENVHGDLSKIGYLESFKGEGISAQQANALKNESALSHHIYSSLLTDHRTQQ